MILKLLIKSVLAIGFTLIFYAIPVIAQSGMGLDEERDVSHEYHNPPGTYWLYVLGFVLFILFLAYGTKKKS
jgi:hypothetical protein